MREWLCEVVPTLPPLPQEFTLEFSRDRKSMSAYCHPTSEENSSPVMFVKVTPPHPSSSSCPTSLPPLTQGAPEGILDRCNFIRANGTERHPLTPEIKQQILEVVKRYGTGWHGNHAVEYPCVTLCLWCRSGHATLPSDGNCRAARPEGGDELGGSQELCAV